MPWGASAGPGHRGLCDRAGGRRDPRGPSAVTAPAQSCCGQVQDLLDPGSERLQKMGLSCLG